MPALLSASLTVSPIHLPVATCIHPGHSLAGLSPACFGDPNRRLTPALTSSCRSLTYSFCHSAIRHETTFHPCGYPVGLHTFAFISDS